MTFRITQGKGFHMTFENGMTISVQFGFGNYCENRNVEYAKPSKNAEIAIWDADGNFRTKEFSGDDDVDGWLTTDEVVAVMEKVRNFKG